MTASDISEELFDKLKLYAPDVVFLHIGGNDIKKKSSCRTITKNIQNIVTEIYKSGAKTVFVGEIFDRDNFSKAPGLTRDSYVLQKNSINRSLYRQYGDKFIKFKDISFPEDFYDDFVHLSDSGLKKYFFRIRRLLLSCRS